ncbi:hypothetical protein H5410_048653 [Solanum commersonii]|uniref:Disease resistance N-terminal domain-containing protein n=1 Tax=Solanum commersonii TaxID=4109 RepID=A0A9J5XIT6_SOLCO|nr:hypothetical protein H5410_048653 [Solanum commersonii]
MVEAEIAKAILKIIEQAISKVIEQAIFLYGVDEQVRELVTELERMRAFLKDVDTRKKIEERVRNWADQIRGLAQDAEGTVEKFAADVKQRSNREDTAYCLCTSLSDLVREIVTRYKVGWDIEKINKRLKNFKESLTTYGIVLPDINEGETSSTREVTLQCGVERLGGSRVIGVERWGGSGARHWNYRPKGLHLSFATTNNSITPSLNHSITPSLHHLVTIFC